MFKSFSQRQNKSGICILQHKLITACF
uniref:Uncharacterized protein n=1 Tax=Anguilla anguilla TaxID=7936 RepID=A0A0E9WA37_ANGAN